MVSPGSIIETRRRRGGAALRASRYARLATHSGSAAQSKIRNPRSKIALRLALPAPLRFAAHLLGLRLEFRQPPHQPPALRLGGGLVAPGAATAGGLGVDDDSSR